jgi:serine O-acetyltransferase
MATRAFQIGEKLPALVDGIVASYQADDRTHHIDKPYLPARAEIIETIELLLELIYPGYFGRQNLSSMNISYHVGELLPKIGERLNHEIFQALCHQAET